MQIFALPEYFTSDSTPHVQLVDYSTSKECSKQQINLKHNAFSFLLEGNKEVITDTNTLTIQNSSFLMMKAGHCLMTEKFSDTCDHYRSILLFFSNESILQFARKHHITPNKDALAASVQAIPYDNFIKSFVNGLIDLATLNADTQRKLLPVKLEELMIYLIDTLGTSFISSLLIHTDRQSYNFLNVIENNKLTKLTLKELAFLSNMSVSLFKREFEKHYHESPSKWFQDKRLDYAAMLLKNESKRPSDIYTEIGYETLSNFIQAFKVKFGVTPKQYQLK